MDLVPYHELDLEAAIEATDRPICDFFQFEFQKERDRARDRGDDQVGRTWHSLMSIASYCLRSGDGREPLVSSGQLGSMRFPGPEDLTDAELDNLANSYPNVEDPDVRARMADVLWIVRRDHRAARVAIVAYVESAGRLHTPDHWVPCHERLERALNLSRSVGRPDPEHAGVIRAVYCALGGSTWPDYPHLPAKLSSLLLGHDGADPKMEAERMASHAEKAESDGDFQVARRHRSLEAQWRRKANDTAAAEAAQATIVDLHEKEADAATSNPFQAARQLEEAIEASRRLAGAQARTEGLIRKLQETHQRLMGQMKRVEVKQDVSTLVQQARQVVAGLDFTDALIALARNVPDMSTAELRALVEQGRQQHPMPYLIQQSVHDKRGRTVAQLPGVPWDEDGGDATLMHMHKHATQFQDGIAATIVEPARSQILADHPASMRDFAPLVEHSRFVPVGREALFERGLLAGLEGDFTEATHILIPQVENSIREIFSAVGVLVVKHLPDRTQRQKDLNDLLSEERADEILGEDLGFTLRGLLIRASGSNLRHRLAHGLIDAAEFNADRFVYLWALVLRLVVGGALPPPAPSETEIGEEPSG